MVIGMTQVVCKILVKDKSDIYNKESLMLYKHLLEGYLSVKCKV